MPLVDSRERTFTPSVPVQKMTNVGAIVVLTHFLLYYGIPGLQCYLFPQSVATTFSWVPLTVYGLAFLAIAVAWTFWLVQADLIGRLARLDWPLWGTRSLASLWRVYPYIRIGLSVLILVLSAVFAAQGLFFYRYSGASLGQSVSPIVGMLVILHAWSMADFLLIVLLMLGDRDFGSKLKWRIPTLIIAISWLISVNGSASAIYGGLFLYLAVLPGIFREHVLIGIQSDGGGLIARKIWMRLSAVLLLIAVLFVGWQAGNLVKTLATPYTQPVVAAPEDQAPPGNAEPVGNTASTQNGTAQLQRGFSWRDISIGDMMTGYADRLAWLPGRLGVSLYSFGVITQKVDDGLYSPLTAWSVIGQNLQFRWSSILHLPAVGRPDIRSVGQLNYRNIEASDVQNDRSGASPGLLAAASYLAPRPLDIVLALAYIGLICVAFARVTGTAPQATSFIGYILLTIMAQEFFLNIADYFLLADGGSVFFVSFIVLAEAANASRTAEAYAARSALPAELSATRI